MSSANTVKTFFRLLLGRYSANDYIRLGRYIAGGVQTDLPKGNLKR